MVLANSLAYCTEFEQAECTIWEGPTSHQTSFCDLSKALRKGFFHSFFSISRAILKEGIVLLTHLSYFSRHYVSKNKELTIKRSRKKEGRSGC
jgi:hypothetical protein